MSGFDRALGALDRQEMLQCARGLLKVLAAEAGASPSAASGGAYGSGGEAGRAGGRGAPAAAGAGASGTGGPGLAAAGRAGSGSGGARGGEWARRGGFDTLAGAEGARESAEAPDGTERRERGLSSGARESVSRGGFDSSGGAGAAFAGPERRYDNAVGARGMEMSRVSDYFRRDSRRYDTGYKRY